MREPLPSNGFISRGIARVVQNAKSAAAAQAAMPIASPSAMKIRAMRACDAPKDRRTAISRARTTARASIRFATFAQTMSSVSPVMIENIARNHGPRCATRLSPAAVAEYGNSWMVRLRHASPGARGSCRAIVASSACAAVSETPGASRPIVTTRGAARSASVARAPSASAYATSGIQMSEPSPKSTPRKSGGATPTIVATWPFTTVVRPMMSADSAKRSRHRCWLMTATSPEASRRSSRSVNVRPLIGRIASVSK